MPKAASLPENITTIIGDFLVHMDYHPISGEDVTLKKLTQCVNTAALPYLQKGYSPEQAFEALDEAKLEEQLFNYLTVGGGAGQRLTLDLKKRTINFDKF